MSTFRLAGFGGRCCATDVMMVVSRILYQTLTSPFCWPANTPMTMTMMHQSSDDVSSMCIDTSSLCNDLPYIDCRLARCLQHRLSSSLSSSSSSSYVSYASSVGQYGQAIDNHSLVYSRHSSLSSGSNSSGSNKYSDDRQAMYRSPMNRGNLINEI